MPFTFGQYIYAKNMLMQLGMEDSTILNAYIDGLERAYSNDYDGSVIHCIENIKEELELKTFKWRIKDNVIQYGPTITATDLSSYNFCPASFSIKKSFHIDAPSNTQSTETGLQLHDEQGLLKQITDIKENNPNIIEWINDPFLNFIKKSEIIYTGHNNQNYIFENKIEKFRGKPDYIFKDENNEFFVVEEKFIHSLQFNTLEHKPIFFNNHRVQLVSYLKNILEYDIKYGYIIYWYYNDYNAPFVHHYSYLKILLNTHYEELYQTAKNGIKSLYETHSQEFDTSKVNLKKCAACIVNKYCGHKTIKFNDLSFPYNRKYMVKKSVQRLRKTLIEYLTNNYPQSDLTAQFGEIVCDCFFTIGAIPPKSIISITVDIFNHIFNLENKSIWILINEFNKYAQEYTLDQFSNKNIDSDSWCSIIEEIKIRQSFLIKKKNEINYINLFEGLLGDNIDSRIYFIDPIDNIVFMFWDDSIFIGGKSIEAIKSIYDKYYDYINEYSRMEFEKHLV